MPVKRMFLQIILNDHLFPNALWVSKLMKVNVLECVTLLSYIADVPHAFSRILFFCKNTMPSVIISQDRYAVSLR